MGEIGTDRQFDHLRTMLNLPPDTSDEDVVSKNYEFANASVRRASALRQDSAIDIFDVDRVLLIDMQRERRIVAATAVGIALGTTMLRAATMGRREVQRVQRAARYRLQQQAGNALYTRTPQGRVDALEATALTIPTLALHRGLHATLEWMQSQRKGFFARNWQRLALLGILAPGMLGLQAVGGANVYAGVILGAVASVGVPTEFQARVMGNGAVRATVGDVQQLKTALHKGRGEVVLRFPHIREVVLTDPDTGKDRPWAVVEAMVRADKSLLYR